MNIEQNAWDAQNACSGKQDWHDTAIPARGEKTVYKEGKIDIAKINVDDEIEGEEIIISLSEDNDTRGMYWILLSNGNDPCIQSEPESREDCELGIEAAWSIWKTFGWIN